MTSHWSEYWKQGHLTSFGESYKKTYTGVLKDQWLPLFSTLKDEFKCLDIATGNGGLAILVDDFAFVNKIRGSITAIDFAKINNHAIDKAHKFKNNILFRELFKAEDVDKLDDNYELIISQFGIEYSDISESIIASKKRLSANGKIGLMMHHSNSAIIQRNERTLTLVRSEAFRACMDHFIKLIKFSFDITSKESLRLLKVNRDAEHHRHQLNYLLKELFEHDEMAIKDTNLPEYVSQFMKIGVISERRVKKQFIEYLKTQIETLQNRLSELVEAALAPDKLSSLIKYAKLNGLTATEQSEVLNESGEILAWFVVFEHSHIE
ncbi:hypothetical protein [Pseudoalteromonas sp. MMG024]|uniref:class I SAM-dependent methyltransferase n=1 Tax=Pseudoalteromonas sp. MMG024 TaxID=2909980 RepID=UPI001F2B881C|nr:hypothetical protein [Pseudoalteromonas sp. MMG024]MCF6458251.1 hypothetical protein [Pseudoalteromonas sp. MMG024]